MRNAVFCGNGLREYTGTTWSVPLSIHELVHLDFVWIIRAFNLIETTYTDRTYYGEVQCTRTTSLLL